MLGAYPVAKPPLPRGDGLAALGSLTIVNERHGLFRIMAHNRRVEPDRTATVPRLTGGRTTDVKAAER